MGDKKHQLHVLLDNATIKALKIKALKTGVTVSEIIRQAVQSLLTQTETQK